MRKSDLVLYAFTKNVTSIPVYVGNDEAIIIAPYFRQ